MQTVGPRGEPQRVEASNDESPLPAPLTVIRRAAVLLALWHRSDREQRGPSLDPFWRRLIQSGLLASLEPEEDRFLRASPGTLPRHEVANTSWRLEGAPVLLWSLSRGELPAVDKFASVDAVANNLARELDGEASGGPRVQLRPSGDLKWCLARTRAIHWRLREARIRSVQLDFRSVAARLGLGDPSRLSIPLIDGDLAIEGRTVAATDPQRLRLFLAAAMERHNAASWLLHSMVPYSLAPVDT